MPVIAAERVFGGAADLEILHALEQAEQLLRLRVGVEPGAIEGPDAPMRPAVNRIPKAAI